jgi:hypothetical protein
LKKVNEGWFQLIIIEGGPWNGGSSWKIDGGGRMNSGTLHNREAREGHRSWTEIERSLRTIKNYTGGQKWCEERPVIGSIVDCGWTKEER